MRASKARYQLWQIMLAIAVLAGLFAIFGVAVEAGIVVVFSIVFLPILLVAPGHRVRAAAWISSIYPLLLLSSLYATWFTAWCVLGHRPRSSLDDPKYISSIVEVPYVSAFLLLYGSISAFLVCPPLAIAHVADRISRRRIGPWKGAAWMLVPLSAWLSFLAILRWDLLMVGSIIGWYMD
jgi:hypothetical protein